MRDALSVNETLTISFVHSFVNVHINFDSGNAFQKYMEHVCQKTGNYHFINLSSSMNIVRIPYCLNFLECI